MVKTIGIIGGAGQFGSFVIERIREVAPEIEILAWDLAQFEHSLKETAACDVVVFTVPPEEYESSMRKIIPMMRKDGIIVDVCGVKMHTVQLLRELADGRSYISTHPMFGRGSFIDQGNSLRGLQVAVCEHTLPPETYIEFEHLLVDSLQLEIVHMTPEEHDRITAEEQLLPQHVGRIIEKAGFARSVKGAHTTSSRHFYTAMEIVSHDEELFHQMCKLNPFWPEIEARYELAAAGHRLETVKRKNGH